MGVFDDFKKQANEIRANVSKQKPSQPVQTNWYKGSQPTQSETLARIYEIGKQDETKRVDLMRMYEEEVNNPSSPIYNPYTQATTSKLNKTNINNTQKALDEWARLSDELSYWATRGDRNYSDDEVIAKIDWGNYKTLQKMDEGRVSGSPLALVDKVGYSLDAMYGVLWAARNPEASTGNAMYDAVQGALGRGNQYKTNDISAYRDATGGKYAPYKAGATALDDLAYKYGMTGDFSREWLEGEGRALLNGDAQSREDYTRIYNTVTATEAVEKEANAFYNQYAKPLIESGMDPAKIFYDGVFEDLEYKNLDKFVKGGKSGDLYGTAYAVGFDYDELQAAANEYYSKTKGKMTNSEYEQQLADNTGGVFIPDEGREKSNEAQRLNTDVLLPDYAPVSTENERKAFRITGSAGYSDVVGTTANYVQNGSGGEEQYKASAIKEANAYANEHLFSAWDDLYQAEEAFAEAGEMSEEVSAVLKENFPEFAKNGTYPTEQEVLDAFRSGKIKMPEGLLPEDQTAYVESVVGAVAGRGQAAEAQDIIDDVMDDLAEAYGKGTEQYNAAVATYKAAYEYTRSPKNVWTAFDNYQYASQQEGVTTEMLDGYLSNQRGANANEILRVKAMIENAEQLGITEKYIANMQKRLDDLYTQNELLNAHNLSKNEDYTAKVGEFDAAYQAYQPKWFNFGANKLTESELIRYSIIDPESATKLVDNRNMGDILLLAQNMTDEERSNYKYIFMTEGEEKANEYFNALSQNLYVRSAEERSERVQGFAEDHPLAGTAGSFLMVPMEAMSAASTIITKLSGEDVNPYSPTFAATQAKGGLRTGSKEAFHQLVGEDKKALNWAFDTVYDAITSAADSGINAVIGGKYGSVLMGLSGFEAGVMDASMRGANDWQAIGYGLASAAIEGITEKAQIDQIFDSFSAGSKAGKDALLKVLSKGFFSEAGEEMLSSIGGAISDEFIMGELSNREAAIEKYMTEAGLTREEAEAQANRDILKDILYSGLVGGLSGVVSSGTSYGAGKIFGKENSASANAVSAPAEATKATPTTTPEAGEKDRAMSALNTSLQQGTSESQRAATVAGVFQSYGLSAIEANAAAKNITDPEDVRILKKMLGKVDDPAKLIRAFAMARVADNSASAVVLGTKINSKNIYAKANELITAYDSDVANSRVSAVYDANVAFSAESDMIAEQVKATGALDHTAVDNARTALKDANEQLGYAREKETAAHQAVVNANAKFNQNPADPQAKAEMKSAIDKQHAAQKKRSEAENRVNAATKKLETEKKALNAKAEEFMGIAREQAKPEVQKHVEEVNTAKAEQEAAKEVQREADNVLAMEADEFIDSHYPNATDEERQQLREQYISLNQSKETPAEPGYKGGAELLAKAGRKFGFRVVVTDDLNNAEGAYMRDENTIYVAKDITQTEAIKRVLLHEMTHAAEGAGQLYTEMRDTLLSMKYGNNKARLDADVAALINDYNQFYASRNIIDKKTGRVKQLTKEQALQELTANVNAEIIAGNQKLIEQLVNEKPSVARRMMDGIKNVIAKMAGVNDPAIDQARNVVKMFEKALSKAQTQSRKFDSDGIQYSIREKEPPSKLGDMQFSIGKKEVYTDPHVEIANSCKGALDQNEYNVIHETITQNPKQYMKLKDMRAKKFKAIPVVYYGDNLKLVCLKPNSEDSYEIVDVYEANVVDFNERLNWFVELFNGGMKYYGEERFVRSHMRFAEAYGAELFRKYDQQSGRFVSFLSERETGRSGRRNDGSNLQGRLDGAGSSENHRGIRNDSVTSEGQLSLPSADILQRQMTAYHASRLNPTEDIVQPKSSKLGVSQFAARTGQNTSVLSDGVKQELRKSPYYQKTSERRNVDIAINNIEIEGYEARRNKLLDGSINLFTPEGQVEAYVLAKAAKEAGDSQGESAIAFKVKESGTLLGQSMAMRKMYLEMTPAGKTQFLQRIVDKINQEYANRNKDTRVVLPEWVETRLEEADGDKELIAKVVDKAYTDIAKQMPPDWKSRMNAWRYTAMLANPRTHIRNVLGNALFIPAVKTKNQIGALAEMMFAAPDERTKAFGLVRKEYKDFAKAQLEDVKDVLTGGGKHNPMSEIQSRRRDFNTPVFEWISKKNGKALEIEDAFFLNNHFVNALSGFLQARNVDVNNVDANTLQAGLDYAILEAQKATYRDASEIADKLSKLSSGLSNSKKRSARAAGLLLEGALPFKKTPVNVMRRGVEYSPVGLINTLTLGVHDMKKGEMTKGEFLDGLASGLTGTGLALVGMWLYNVGNLKLKLDEPEDELEKLAGSQEYSIEIGGVSFTIDWLSPSAMPLFVGGAIAELMKADDKELNLDTIGDALLSIAEPVFNLSMLDGVNSMLSAASNSENGVVDIVMRAGESYASQFVPTILGAIARTADPVRRTTYTDKNSGVPSTLQYLYDSTVNKVPGASFSGQAYLNAWGEEDVTDNVILRAVENFLSPGYINEMSTDEAEKGLMELFDATKDEGLIPKTPQKYFTVNKQRKDLTGEEYEKLTKERGQTAKNLHMQLFDSPEFLGLPAYYQVYALEQVWEYATQTAKHNIAPEYKVDSWVAGAADPAKTILEKTQDKVKSDRSKEMKNELYGAIDSGDLATAATYVEGIMQGGTEKGSLRTSITNQYKSKYQQMYADGDIEGMRQLENTLLALNVGYKMATIQKWIIDSEE